SLESKQISLVGNNTLISSSNSGLGTAGGVTVGATPVTLLTIDGATIESKNSGTGGAGSVNINSDRFVLSNGGKVSVDAAFGLGGDIAVASADSIWIGSGSQVTARAGGSLPSGIVSLDSKQISLLGNGTLISSTNSGSG